MNHFTIPGKLPGMNEIISENRRGWQAGARQKKDADMFVRFCIRNARKSGEIWPMRGRVAIYICWQERTALRDPDNVFAGTKFILDAWVAEKILSNDNRRNVGILTNQYVKGDKDEITVQIELLEGNQNDDHP